MDEPAEFEERELTTHNSYLSAKHASTKVPEDSEDDQIVTKGEIELF